MLCMVIFVLIPVLPGKTQPYQRLFPQKSRMISVSTHIELPFFHATPYYGHFFCFNLRLFHSCLHFFAGLVNYFPNFQLLFNQSCCINTAVRQAQILSFSRNRDITIAWRCCRCKRRWYYYSLQLFACVNRIQLNCNARFYSVTVTC